MHALRMYMSILGRLKKGEKKDKKDQRRGWRGKGQKKRRSEDERKSGQEEKWTEGD